MTRAPGEALDRAPGELPRCCEPHSRRGSRGSLTADCPESAGAPCPTCLFCKKPACLTTTRTATTTSAQPVQFLPALGPRVSERRVELSVKAREPSHTWLVTGDCRQLVVSAVCPSPPMHDSNLRARAPVDSSTEPLVRWRAARMTPRHCSRPAWFSAHAQPRAMPRKGRSGERRPGGCRGWTGLPARVPRFAAVHRGQSSQSRPSSHGLRFLLFSCRRVHRVGASAVPAQHDAHPHDAHRASSC